MSRARGRRGREKEQTEGRMGLPGSQREGSIMVLENCACKVTKMWLVHSPVNLKLQKKWKETRRIPKRVRTAAE